MGKKMKLKPIKDKSVKVVAMIMMLLLLLLPFMIDVAFAESAVGTKVTYKGAISSMGSTCGKFTILGHDAFCAEHSEPTPSTGTKITASKLVTNVTMRKALYYGYGGPMAKVSKNNAGWVSTSIALSRANGKGGGTTDAQKFYKSLKDYATPPDSFKVYYCTTSGNVQDLCYWIYQPEGQLKIKKISSDEAATVAKGYELSGAVFGIYTKKECTSGSRVSKLTTGSTGVTEKVTLDKGTYYIKEISAPKGFKLSSSVTSVSITDQCDKTLTIKNTPEKVELQLMKSSANPDKTKGKEGYSLAGAKYTIWSDAALTKSVGVLTTDSEGKSNVVSVLAGKYYIKEVNAPKGFLLDDKVYEVEVGIADLNEVKILEVEDVPEDEPAWILLQKIDGETGEPTASGIGTLAGAKFIIKYYEGTNWTEDPAKSGAKDKGKWTFKTNENGCVRFDDDTQLISGDELYYNDMGNPTFPVGTITIQEVKAPKGYLLNDNVFVVNIPHDDNDAGVSLSQIPTTEVIQTPIRGDIEIVKTDSKTGEKLEGVVFEVIDTYTDSVIMTLTTDKNGYATTASPQHPDGMLRYGKYIVREKTTPVGYLPIDDVKVMIDKNKEKICLDLENVPAEIKTKAMFTENGSNEIKPHGMVTIVDEVTYENLIPGGTYRLLGILMDKSTETPLILDGDEIVSEIEFTAEESCGKKNMEFTIDGGLLAGKAITVFEYLYIEETLVAEHADINNMNQTVRFLPAGNIEIYKGDSVTGEPLEGVKFEIIRKDDKEIVSVLVTDENGYATTEGDDASGLLYGDYIIRETEPLAGYMPIEDIDVTLDNINKTMSVKIDNTPIAEETIETSDIMGRTIPLVVALLCIALFGVVIATTDKRKKEQ